MALDQAFSDQNCTTPFVQTFTGSRLLSDARSTRQEFAAIVTSPSLGISQEFNDHQPFTTQARLGPVQKGLCTPRLTSLSQEGR